MLIGQVDPAAVGNAAGSLLNGRSDTIFLIVLFCVMFGLYFWKVVLPDREAKRVIEKEQQNIQAQQTQTLADLSRVTTNIDQNTVTTHQHTKAIVNVLGKFVDCMSKATKDSSVDISDDLAEMRGMLTVVRQEK